MIPVISDRGFRFCRASLCKDSLAVLNFLRCTGLSSQSGGVCIYRHTDHNVTLHRTYVIPQNINSITWYSQRPAQSCNSFKWILQFVVKMFIDNSNERIKQLFIYLFIYRLFPWVMNLFDGCLSTRAPTCSPPTLSTSRVKAGWL